MDIASLLFRFDGRIRRLHYWLAAIGAGVMTAVAFDVLFALSGLMVARPNPIILSLMPLLSGLDIWIALALGVKRCHDRGRSGGFLLVGLIPMIGWLWLTIELGFVDGTPGPNRYGPSPKGLGAAALAA